MAFTIGAIAADDGGGNAVGGGLIAADIAGGGVGPWFLFHGLIDGVAGVNRAAIDANNALKIAVASGGIASGAIASGAIASGAIASGAVASGAFASGSIASGAIAAGAIAQGTTAIAQVVDVAYNAADVVVKIGAVRDDALATLTPADNDWTVLRTTSTGALWVQDASLNANGQATSANSSPVVIASDQSPVATVGKTVVKALAFSTDTSAYASGDLIADTQQLDAAFRVADGTGILNSITIIDQDNQGAALYIGVHCTTTSMGTENSAPNISDANLAAGLIGWVAVATTDYTTVSGAKVANIRNIGLPVKAVSGTDDLYFSVLNSTGTPTYTATGLNVQIGILQD